MAKIEAFERFSDVYDAWFEENADKYEAELALIRRLLPASGAGGIEVGIGSGKFAVPFGIRTGVEPSREMAIKARLQGIQVIAGVAEHLPLIKDCFDFVLMVTTICFVDDLSATFAEAWRVLKPGGWFVVGFVDKESDLGRHYEAHRDQSRFYREATFFSIR
jgi:SAM-dependent methyltransferase